MPHQLQELIVFATSFILVWVALGCASAAALSVPSESRWAWMPMAGFFGPLWLFVATEMRTRAADESTMVPIAVLDRSVRCSCDFEE